MLCARAYGTGILKDAHCNRPWVFSIMQKIPEISDGIQTERSVSVSFKRNIQDHLWRWSAYFGWNIPTENRRLIFDKPVLCRYEGSRK